LDRCGFDRGDQFGDNRSAICHEHVIAGSDRADYFTQPILQLAKANRLHPDQWGYT
jgi:hypothetical protein